MNKSERDTYKKLSQNRLFMRKLMKLPRDERKLPNNEIKLPDINIKNTPLKRYYRNIKGDSFPNPFDIPAREKVFGINKITGQRKIKPIPFIMEEPKTKCDVDGDFYKVIDGRPIRRLDDVKVYLRDIRHILLTKANAAYLKDKMLLMDTKNAYELEEYNKILSLYIATKNNFVRFAKQSYIMAKECESKAELMADKVAKISDVLDGYCFEYISLKNQMFKIMYTFEVLMTYGKFLHSISPVWWRIQFDNLNSNIDFNEGISLQQDSQKALLMGMASLNEFKAKTAKYSLLPVRIYFKQPKQVIKFFENTSRQCRNYLTLNIVSSKYVRCCIKGRDNLKLAFKEHEDVLQDDIVAIKAELAFMDTKELEYKSAFEKLLHNSFYKLYAGHDTVKLFTCLQYVTSRIFGDFEDPYDTASSLMGLIEQEYMDLSLGMDYLDISIVRNTTKQTYAHDSMVMRKAHLAQRALKECDIMRKSLFACFEPPRASKLNRARTSKDVKNVTDVPK